MPDVYCPVCSGHVVALQASTCKVTPGSLAVSFPYIAVCLNCSLVSELDGHGRLIDLGNITLADLEMPVVAGVDTPRCFIQSGSTLLMGRRDS